MSSEIKLADVGDEQSLRMFARRLKQHPAYKVAKPALDAVKNSLPLAIADGDKPVSSSAHDCDRRGKKGGNERLYANLLKHPRCFAAVEKEIDYFSEHPDRSVAWYRSRFPLRRRVLRRGGHVLEVSPSYLPTPECAATNEGGVAGRAHRS